eukprot:TRINITY_DN2589_c0_g2_i4.p1 TRINITY_DN2589_c0_g2~~TRINITY_DN2589_c0_g2_i4.p1  ORF type:complete len:501 (+),score=45.04 TRINITY_DN2589_c0_g2_i4:91-1593(+)
MEELDVELLSYLVEACSWEPSVIAKIACLSRGLADMARTVLWPRYCKHRYPEVTESVLGSLTRAITESVLPATSLAMSTHVSVVPASKGGWGRLAFLFSACTRPCAAPAEPASEKVRGKAAESLPATNLATSADLSVVPAPEGGWARLAFLFSACPGPCAAPPTHPSLEGKFTTEFAREIFLIPDGDVVWAARCLHAPYEPPDYDYDYDYMERPPEGAADGEHIFRGLIIDFQASQIYKELSESNPGLFKAPLTPERSTPLPRDRPAEIAAKGAGQWREAKSREESRPPSDLPTAPTSSALNPPGLSAEIMILPAWEGEKVEQHTRDLSHREKEEDYGKRVQGSHIQGPSSSLPPRSLHSHLSPTYTRTDTTSAAPFSATTTTPPCSRPSLGTPQSVSVEDLKLEGGSTSADLVEREVAKLEGAVAREVECETMSRCGYCNSKKDNIAWSMWNTNLLQSANIVSLYICIKGHFYGKLRTTSEGVEDIESNCSDDYGIIAR